MENKQRILVIDDDVSMRELLNAELTDEGYEVTTSESAFEGMAFLQNKSFALVVLDIKMPGMDGIEALGRIIGIERGLPVIIHSAFSHYKDNYLTWSAADYVVKSGDFTKLKTAIQKLIGRDAE